MVASPLRVVFFAYPGVQALDVSGPLEIFARATRLLRDEGRPHAGYSVCVAALEPGPITASSGFRFLPDHTLSELGGLIDTLLVIGGIGIDRVVGEQKVLAWLRRTAPRVRRLVSVCTGAFLLAEAGLLDGRRVTTHWAYCGSLAAKYPRVRVEEDPIFVRDGNVATSAGVTAGIDLALALVEDDLGRDAALDIARHLVVFLRRPGNQAQFSAQLAGQLAGREPLRDVQRLIADHPAADLSVEALASQASLSPRQFARAFAAEVGMPPGRYVDLVRLETARRRLEDTADGVEQTARFCGYRTPEAMRRAFIRTLGVSPGEYRRRFRPTATHG